MRPPRFLHPDGVIRPYLRYQAEGDSLLKVKSVANESTSDRNGHQSFRASLHLRSTFDLYQNTHSLLKEPHIGCALDWTRSLRIPWLSLEN